MLHKQSKDSRYLNTFARILEYADKWELINAFAASPKIHKLRDNGLLRRQSKPPTNGQMCFYILIKDLVEQISTLSYFCEERYII